MPYVVKAYEMFGKDGFEILGVTVKDERVKSETAEKKLNMTWSQIYGATWDDVQKNYGISSIPNNLLVNPEGIIVARGLRGDELIETLQSIFDK